MRSAIVIVVLLAKKIGNAHDSADTLVDNLVKNVVEVLFGRTLNVVPLYPGHLGDVMLGKSGHPVILRKASYLAHPSHLAPRSSESSAVAHSHRATTIDSASPWADNQLHFRTEVGHSDCDLRRARVAVTAMAAAGSSDSALKTEQTDDGPPLALLLYPDDGKPSFVETEHLGNTLASLGEKGNPLWPQAAAQLVQRARWDLGEPLAADIRALSLKDFCLQAECGSLPHFRLVLGMDLFAPPPVNCEAIVQNALASCPQRLFISSSPDQTVGEFWHKLTRLGGAGADEFDSLSNPFIGGLKAALGGVNLTVARLGSVVAELVHRRTAEEAVYAILVLMDGAMRPVSAMQAQNPVPTSDSARHAIDKCKDEVQACFTQLRCLQTLNCITNCGLADQSCSYKCITSYQNEAFTQFSLCVLQKQNILNSQIVRPTTPLARPIETFRGAPLTQEVADDILVGHFNPAEGRRYSWIVAAGSNPAFEQFQWQYQLWYRGSGKGSFWYHPVFMVETLDGRKIWRERDYRVRRQKTPGLWEFSVLDNGIISEEKWHLLGVDEDLRWCVLFYIGAARKAGLAYRGCILLTRDGDIPSGAAAAEGIASAVARAGLKPWELEAVSNPPQDPTNPPPLIAPETQPPAPLLTVAAVA